MAYKLGDPTAKYEGRLTLNPLSHLDPIGALMFLFVGFGWAKPVPINPVYFKDQRKGIALTAIAGPLSNLILGSLAFFALMLIGPHVASTGGLFAAGGGGSVFQELFVRFFASSVFVNFALMAFNLLPIAPLDGSKVLQMFIPLRYEDEYAQFMRYGPFILLGIIVFERVLPIPILSYWVYGIVNGVMSVLSLIG